MTRGWKLDRGTQHCPGGWEGTWGLVNKRADARERADCYGKNPGLEYGGWCWWRVGWSRVQGLPFIHHSMDFFPSALQKKPLLQVFFFPSLVNKKLHWISAFLLLYLHTSDMLLSFDVHLYPSSKTRKKINVISCTVDVQLDINIKCTITDFSLQHFHDNQRNSPSKSFAFTLISENNFVKI